MAKLELLVNIGGVDQVLSTSEARELFNDLSSIFGNVHIPSPHEIRPNNGQHIVHNEEKKVVKSNSNPRVEAARRKAQERTSGCGTR